MPYGERRYTRGPVGEVSYLLWAGDRTRTAVLYLHPVNTAAAVWRATVDVSEVGPVRVAVDYRAHGRSEEGGSYLPADYARDALAAIDAEGLDRVHVVCGSIGGAVAVELAAAVPGRVASIVAFGATLHLGWSDDVLDDTEKDLRALGVRGWFDAHGAEILGPAARADAAAELTGLAAGGRDGDRNLDTVVTVLRTTFGAADARATAAGLTDRPPARVVVGTHDPTCPPEMARELAAALGGDRGVVDVETVPDIGHLPMLEDPRGVAESVRRFQEELR
ncbi:alpha/beta fold hydrolase [Pseudonocardia sp. ICBG601]|uniref:alpha/beta fold hydrolase n=1 Tax=Pseudonocardia sp. ICBG601 TaxID=2846759 RepID=UPI001CF65444|nr:alpha/beta hydrolase [Pseudonocardia sp. ICBG601]